MVLSSFHVKQVGDDGSYAATAGAPADGVVVGQPSTQPPKKPVVESPEQ